MDPITASQALYTAGSYLGPIVAPILLGMATNALKNWGTSVATEVVVEGAAVMGNNYGGSTGEWIGRKIGWFAAPKIIQSAPAQNTIDSFGNVITTVGVAVASQMATDAVDILISPKNDTKNQGPDLDKEYKAMKLENMKVKHQINLAKLEKANLKVNLLKNATVQEDLKAGTEEIIIA